MLLTEALHRWAGYSNGLEKQEAISAKVIRFIIPALCNSFAIFSLS